MLKPMRSTILKKHEQLADQLYSLAIEYETSTDPSLILKQIDELSLKEYHLFTALKNGNTALTRLAKEGHLQAASLLSAYYCRANRNDIVNGLAQNAAMAELEIEMEGAQGSMRLHGPAIMGYAQGGHPTLADELIVAFPEEFADIVSEFVSSQHFG
jgi:hypothetical protein